MDYRARSRTASAPSLSFHQVDGKPFIESDSGEMRFFTEVGKAVKINKRFEVSK
jgi:hypothetical protein